VRTTDVTEQELSRAAQGGDAQAFGRLVLLYAAVARQVAYAVVSSWDEAEDAVQDAALAAWQAVAGFDPTRPFRPWFLRIVSNASLDLIRRRRVRQTEPLQETVASTDRSPEQWTDRVLVSEKITVAMAQLPERHRVAVMLFDLEGYSHAEIAAVLAVPEGTVRSYVFHARRALRRSLRPLVEEPA
jgi:RNA polymerase sigma-70 factor (ECF subfamily)